MSGPVWKILVLSFFCSSQLQARTWTPPSKVPKPRIVRGTSAYNYGNAVVGPVRRSGSYSVSEADKPSLGQVQSFIGAQKAGSPLELGAQGLTAGTPGCADNGVQARLASLLAQIQGIASEVLRLQALVSQYAAQCSPGNLGACSIALDYSYEALEVAQRALPLAAQAQALQGQVSAACSPGSQLGLPPSINMDSVAKKFGIDFKELDRYRAAKGGLGSSTVAAAGFNPAQANAMLGELRDFAQSLQSGGNNEDDWQRMSRVFDGNQLRMAAVAGEWEKAKDAWQDAKDRVKQGDTAARAERDYYQINYEALGEKYQGLADEQHALARQTVDKAIADLPSITPGDLAPTRQAAYWSDGPQGQLLDLSLAVNYAGNFSEGVKENFIEKSLDQATEYFTSLFPSQQSQEAGKGIIEVFKIVANDTDNMFSRVTDKYVPSLASLDQTDYSEEHFGLFVGTGKEALKTAGDHLPGAGWFQ
jgi:hypothetical protein